MDRRLDQTFVYLGGGTEQQLLVKFGRRVAHWQNRWLLNGDVLLPSAVFGGLVSGWNDRHPVFDSVFDSNLLLPV